MEARVGIDGGAAGIGIATGLSAGAVTELGMTGFLGGAAGGVDVGTGARFGQNGNPSGGASATILNLMKMLQPKQEQLGWFRNHCKTAQFKLPEEKTAHQ